MYWGWVFFKSFVGLGMHYLGLGLYLIAMPFQIASVSPAYLGGRLLVSSWFVCLEIQLLLLTFKY